MPHSDLETSVEATAKFATQSETLAQDVVSLAWSVATAESLTAGTVVSVLAAAPEASEWLAGSIVAYDAEVKFGLLGVPRGPVVTEACARRMAEATARLLHAELCVAVTGVGGPDPEEGEEPGTVWFAVTSPSGTTAEKVVFEGSPSDVVAATTERALSLLARAAAGARADGGARTAGAVAVSGGEG